MKKSRLIEVLQSFSGREIRRFGKYLVSPYLNTHEDVVRLYEYIINVLRRSNKVGLDKKLAFQQVFPKQAYKDREMRLLMSILLKQAERFLSMEEYRTDEVTAEVYLIRSYRRRKLSKSFYRSLKNSRVRQQKNIRYDAVTQYRLSSLHEEEYLFSFGENRQGATIFLLQKHSGRYAPCSRMDV